MSDLNFQNVPSKQQLSFDESKKKSVVERQPPIEAVESITGTIQKRKSTFKAIKPTSLKNSSEIDETSNLLKFKNSHLGKSAPCVFSASTKLSNKEYPNVPLRKISHQVSQIRSPAVHHHRYSCLSPRSQSPISQSPIESPRMNSPSTNHHFQFMPFKRLSANKVIDNSRRWSIVSLPSSSGYASTTPCSSNLSSGCSSSERLHQFPHAPTNDELRALNNRFSGSENIGKVHQSIQKQQSHPLTQNLSSSAIHQPLRKCAITKNYSPSPPPPISIQNHTSLDENYQQQAPTVVERRPRPTFFRPRSRSLSSPSRSPVSENDPSTMNQLFKERFPRAIESMEAKLNEFIKEYRTQGIHSNRDSQPIVRFVTNQIVEIARDCLHKLHSKQVLTSRYFGEMSDSLQRLLLETNEKSPEASADIAKIIKKLILIISRPARLLECLEFDPEQFYKLLEATEDQCKGHVTNDLPIYVITKLGLNNRDSIPDIHQHHHHHHERAKKSGEFNKNIINESSDKATAVADKSFNCNDLSTEKLSDISIKETSFDEKQQQQQHDASIISLSSSDASYLTSTPKKQSSNNNNDNNLSQDPPSDQSSSLEKQPVPNENDYEILKLISNGAYGSVYLVKQKQTKQRFALKKINKNNLILRNQVEQVFTERDILSFTDNPFVVTMYASFETRKHLCLVMEYVEGGDCASLLKNTGPLPSDMAKLYFAELLLAVEYLHSYGIVHRDLKPDNMLITALGHIKLTDFGLSKMGLMSMTTHLYEGYVDQNSETRQFSDKQIFGTPDYIAPEVILRQGYGKTIDYWSMGIILFEFLVGCVPFYAESAEELFVHVVNDAKIEWPSEDDWHIDDEARNLISGLLQQDPQERLGSQGPQEVKDHPYLVGIEWNSLLRYKAEFIPQLENDEDTSYFDSRVERYNHEFEDSDTDDSPILSSSFASYSPQYRKHCHNSNRYSANYGSDESSSSLNESNQKLSLDIRNLNLNPSRIKMPSTPVDPPFVEFGDINSPDRVPPPSFLLRHQQIKHVYNTADVLEQQNQQRLRRSLKMLNISTPDSDHSSDHDLSPKIQRRRKNLIAAAAEEKLTLPKLSISTDHQHHHHVFHPQLSPSPLTNTLHVSDTSKRVMKSASAVDLSLKVSPHVNEQRVIENIRRGDRTRLKLDTTLSGVAHEPKLRNVESDPNLDSDNAIAIIRPPIGNNGGSSTASSREVSPSRDGPSIANLKPPIILRRGPNGFGFVIQTIRVYFGDSDFYTMHHLVMSVNEITPAFEAGLRPGDLITHINGESIQGLFHTQVLQLLLSSHEHVTIRATPLKNTSIQIGGRKRDIGQSKMAKKVNARPKKQKGSGDKKRRISLFRRISSKIANAEIQQMTSSGALSPLTPSRSFNSFTKDIRPGPRLSLSPLDPFHQQVNITSQASSSQSSSPSSSVPNTPTTNLNTSAPVYQRPSSLHGLKHKLHTIGSGKSPSSSRRKSVCHIPLSPLARTPSPSSSGAPNSPTRSPSPLAFCLGHQVGASNLTQSYTPSGSHGSQTNKSSTATTTGNTAPSSTTSKIQKTNSFKSLDKS